MIHSNHYKINKIKFLIRDHTPVVVFMKDNSLMMILFKERKLINMESFTKDNLYIINYIVKVGKFNILSQNKNKENFKIIKQSKGLNIISGEYTLKENFKIINCMDKEKQLIHVELLQKDGFKMVYFMDMGKKFIKMVKLLKGNL